MEYELPRNIEPATVKVANLDLNDLYIDKTGFAAQLGQTLTETGFCIIRNHGIPDHLIQSAFDTARQVFALDPETKSKYLAPKEHLFERGYIPFGAERHAGQKPDLKEMWHIGREQHLANIWPSEVPMFEETLSALYAQLDQCAEPILEACALYLGERETLLSEMTPGGASLLRVIMYPPLSDPRCAGKAGDAKWGGEHTDINFLTFLCPSTEAGLEVRSRSGVWVPVNAGPGELILNVGDMLQNLTNGVFLSGLHRVVNPGDPNVYRMSMPFFIHPRADISLRPLESCVKRLGHRDPNCRDLTQLQYLTERIRETY